MKDTNTQLDVKAGHLVNDPNTTVLVITVTTRAPSLVRIIKGVAKCDEVPARVMAVVAAACNLEDKTEELHRVQ